MANSILYNAPIIILFSKIISFHCIFFNLMHFKSSKFVGLKSSPNVAGVHYLDRFFLLWFNFYFLGFLRVCKSSITAKLNLEISSMSSTIGFVLIYPYAYQTFAVFVSFLFLVFMGLIAIGLYKLITWKLSAWLKTVFHRFLLFLGISLAVFFFAELTLSVITIFQINKQIGFSHATPETPE